MYIASESSTAAKVGLRDHQTINYNEFDMYDELDEVIESSSPYDTRD